MIEADRSVRESAQDISEMLTADEIRRSGPIASVLSNGKLVSAVTAAGATRITYDGVAVNRFRPDYSDYRVFIRDVETGRFWSTTPDSADDGSQRVLIDAGRIGFERSTQGIRSTMEVFVSTEDDVEIRRVTLRNESGRARRLDVTSYVEVVLAEAHSDAAHPAFLKLFVQTAYRGETHSIRAWRRKRSPDDREIHFTHMMAGDGRPVGFETSRLHFLGRRRSHDSPAGMDAGAKLQGLEGSVLDPVAVLRREIELEPEGEATVVIATGAGDSAEMCDRIDARLNGPSFSLQDDVRAAGAREVERLLMHRIGVEKAQYFRRLAGAVLIGDDRARAPSEMVARVTAPIERLSDYGLDPNRPIMVARVSDEEDARLIRTLLKAHRYWTSLGVSVDVIIFNDRSETEAAEDLQVLIEETAEQMEAPLYVRGGVQTVYSDDIPAEDQMLIQSCARVLIREQFPDLRSPRQSATSPGEPIARPASRAAAEPPLSRPDLLFDNGYGGFTEDGREFATIVDVGDNGRHLHPPLPWTNVVANDEIGFIVTESGAGYTWSANSRENRITRWSNDPVLDPHSEAFYIRDEDENWYWSPMPGPAPAPASYHVYHGTGYSRFETTFGGLKQSVVQCVHRDAAVKLSRVRIENLSDKARTLSIFAFHDLVIGGDDSISHRLADVRWDRKSESVVACNRTHGPSATSMVFAAARASEGHVLHATDADAFLGSGGLSAPHVVEHLTDLDAEAIGRAPAAILQVRIEIPPHSDATADFLLGTAPDERSLRALLKDLTRSDERDRMIADARQYWDDLIHRLQISTPSAPIDMMVNRWLPYQNLSCRIRGRSAFYQSGGAFGFRDQLQDAAAMLYLDPHITRRQILLHARHQFVEGDVLHWWHPPTNKGIRTRFSDDLLWLPFVTAHYVRATGDTAVLNEEMPFLTSRQLEAGEDEAPVHPEESGEAGSVFEHCCRAIDRSLTRGQHGLPLMGTGDWNDGMNRVGRDGRGESVWLGFFLYHILGRFIPICESRGDADRASRYQSYRSDLLDALNDAGWDGSWYRRAFYDSGEILGSAQSDEAKIDALAQAWAVLSGAASDERAASALDALDEHLVDEDAGIIRLLTPAFDKTENDPGYIKGYVPGVRENGGQYTHAALWAVQALAEAGRGERAARLLEMLSPISHSRTKEAVETYQVEPYVIAADVYGEEPHVGRGGWTWYTGSAGWMYRVAVESILGFSMEDGETLVLNPSVPSSWDQFSITYHLPGEATTYRIHVENTDGRTRGIRRSVTVDGKALQVDDGIARIPIERDGAVHEVSVEM